VGEIAEALKKANAERDVRRREDEAAPGPELRCAKEAPLESPPERPDERASEWALRATATEAPGRVTDIDLHRHLALRIRSDLEQRGARSAVIVSALRNEGKTTVACKVAMAMASISRDRTVALVDLDLRNPSVARRMKLRPRAGIEEVLLGGAKLDDARICLDRPALDVYPGLTPQRSAHELLAGQIFDDMLRDLEARYGTILIDSPPTLLLPDSTLILQRVDTCILVAHVGATRVRQFRNMLEMLPADRILGKVLNGTTPPKHQREYYYHGYGDEKAES
jgi:Mrp family chromosome partitioning ATPase